MLSLKAKLGLINAVINFIINSLNKGVKKEYKAILRANDQIKMEQGRFESFKAKKEAMAMEKAQTATAAQDMVKRFRGLLK